MYAMTYNLASCARVLPNYAKIVMSMGLARGGGSLGFPLGMLLGSL